MSKRGWKQVAALDLRLYWSTFASFSFISTKMCTKKAVVKTRQSNSKCPAFLETTCPKGKSKAKQKSSFSHYHTNPPDPIILLEIHTNHTHLRKPWHSLSIFYDFFFFGQMQYIIQKFNIQISKLVINLLWCFNM